MSKNKGGNMGTNRSAIARLGILVMLILPFLSCSKGRDGALSVLTSAETDQYEGQGLQAGKIAELKADIAKYEADVERVLKDGQKLGNFYKLLAYAYLNDQQYGPALDTFKRAIYFYPDNYILHTMAGVTSGKLAKAQADEAERARYFKDAEQYFLNAISLRDSYTDALYGLSILYIFELGRPLEAEPLLLRILEREKSNTDTMFLLARVYAADGRIDEAAALYDRIISTTKDKTAEKQAKENKQAVLQAGGGNGGN